MVLHVVCSHFRSVFLICKYKKQIHGDFFMRIENANASNVLERILSAYGFTMQKELAEHLDIAKSNVAGWLQRGQIPGNVIVQCALDTGAEVSWIVTGELAKANFGKLSSLTQGKALYDEIMSNGGRPVLRRILDAYGFTLQKQLCDLLGISSGTVSTWVRREYFPGDVVVTCALDTGVSLEWLATGKNGNRNAVEIDACSNVEKLVKYDISAGELIDRGAVYIDRSFLSDLSSSYAFVVRENIAWIVNLDIKKISNGTWLISVDGSHDIYEVSRMPGNIIKLKNESVNFQCAAEDVICIGQVRRTIL